MDTKFFFKGEDDKLVLLTEEEQVSYSNFASTLLTVLQAQLGE